VTLLPRALWDAEGTARFGGVQTGAAICDQGAEVATTTIPALLEQFGMQQVDLFKMDIEGAEVPVQKSGAGSWLKQVKVLLLETHGPQIEEAVIPLLRSRASP